MISAIHKILLDTHGGGYNVNTHQFDTEVKANVIRALIRSVLDKKMIHYKAEHQRVLDEAASTLELALPRDILMNTVLSFLELPPACLDP